MYSGHGPNHTIDYIIKQSPIIELYRQCHENIEENFRLLKRTIKHMDPPRDIDDLTDIIWAEMRVNKVHKVQKGCG